MVVEKEQDTETVIPAIPLETMSDIKERPDVLYGSTYKIKPPTSDHAIYITINDVILNRGTEHESRQPYEIFVDSKNMVFFPWIVALTLVLSAVFRSGQSINQIVNELTAVFDPNGGYFKRGGKYMPSVSAEIGHVINEHILRLSRA